MASQLGYIHDVIERLHDCPLVIARTEIELLKKLIDDDLALSTIVERIMGDHRDNIDSPLARLLSKPSDLEWSDLGFANSPSARAATGYRVCEILNSYTKAEEFRKTVLNVGGVYLGWKLGSSRSRGIPPFEAIRTMTQIFLTPLVQYLEVELDDQDRLLRLLSRYKQRCEWFNDGWFDEVIEDKSGDLEARMRPHLYRYLFDNGVEFSIESETPAAGGEVDILPVVGDGVTIPLEVKVYDGDRRPVSKVTDGIAQTSDYARKFNRPFACLFAYNASQDTILTFSGEQLGSGISRLNFQNTPIYAVTANVERTLNSSSASHLKTVTVPIPMED